MTERDGSIKCEFADSDKNVKGAPLIDSVHKKLFKELDKLAPDAVIPKFDIKGKLFPAKCINVYDGDTIHAAICYNDVIYDFVIRMYGYNSAELRTKDVKEKQKGIESKEYIESMILNKNIFVHMLGHDKYGGRWLGNVYSASETSGSQCLVGKCINSEMISAGHGKPYFGSGEKKY